MVDRPVHYELTVRKAVSVAINTLSNETLKRGVMVQFLGKREGVHVVSLCPAGDASVVVGVNQAGEAVEAPQSLQENPFPAPLPRVPILES